MRNNAVEVGSRISRFVEGGRVFKDVNSSSHNSDGSNLKELV